MQSNPRASLVVPFYDVEDYIDHCLASIAQQTLRELEVLLVDDGSRDGSLAIAEEYCTRDSRFRLHRQDNGGLADARNNGAALAVGDYLMFVDSDDLLPPRAVELLVGRLDRSGSEMAVGNARRFDLGTTEPSWGQSRSAADDLDATTIEQRPAIATDRIACNKMFRTSIWKERRYHFPAMRYEDYPVVLAALMDASSIDTVSEPVYYWRHRTDGASITQRSHDVGNAVDRLESARRVLDLVDARATAEVATEVRILLSRIDVPAVLMAFAGATDDEQHQLADEVQRLVDRLDTPALRPKSGLLALQLDALAQRDYQALRAYARSARSGGERTIATRQSRTRPWRREFVLPGARARPRPASDARYLVPHWRQRLITSVESINADGHAVVMAGRAAIEFGSAKQTLAVSLSGDDSSRALDAAVGDDGVFHARLSTAALLRSEAGIEQRWGVSASVRSGWLRRRGPLVHVDGATRPASALVESAAGRWVRTGIGDNGELSIEVLVEPVVASGVELDGHTIRIVLQNVGHPDIELRDDADRSYAVEARRVGDTVVASVDLRRLADEPPAENPASSVAEFSLWAAGSALPALSGSVLAPTYWATAEWTVIVTRSLDGRLVIRRMPAAPIVIELETKDDSLLLRGIGPAPHSASWWAGNGRLPIGSIRGSHTGGWSASVSWAALHELIDAGRVDERIAVSVHGQVPIHVDGFLAASLPRRVAAGQWHFVLRRRGDAIAVARS
ncbi:MAG: glycosyltransferase family 2 protein [Actinomycetota bacterium]